MKPANRAKKAAVASQKTTDVPERENSEPPDVAVFSFIDILVC